MTVTIYHNPKCSNSRGALAIIRDKGIQPIVIDYLKTPPSRADLKALVALMGVAVRDVMRTREPVYAELKLDDANDDVLLGAIAMHPILLNRPIVVTPKGAKLCRPGETVTSLL